MRIHHFWIPKDGNSEAEYEDACANNPQAGRFALADGATESSFAKEWAKILTKGFADEEDWGQFFQQPRSWWEWRSQMPKYWSQWLEAMRRRWQEHLQQRQSERGGTWPWFVENRIREGALATFCGLVLLPDIAKPEQSCRQCKDSDRSATRHYFCLAVGDACLFQVRDDRLVFCFPVQKAVDFNNTPPLVCSQSRPPARPTAPLRWCVRRWNEGDIFLLMTDALARWFLSDYESGAQPWQEIRRRLLEPNTFGSVNPGTVSDDPLVAVSDSDSAASSQEPPTGPTPDLAENHVAQPLRHCQAATVTATESQERFRCWVAELRHQSKLCNDDVTLLVVESARSR
jgi:hypothetical protein